MRDLRERQEPRLLVHPRKWIFFQIHFNSCSHSAYIGCLSHPGFGRIDWSRAPSYLTADSWVPLALNGLERAARCRLPSAHTGWLNNWRRSRSIASSADALCSSGDFSSSSFHFCISLLLFFLLLLPRCLPEDLAIVAAEQEHTEYRYCPSAQRSSVAATG